MTKIFKAMPFGSARGERQDRIKSVECLNPENWNTGGEKSFRDRKSQLEPSLNLRHFQIAVYLGRSNVLTQCLLPTRYQCREPIFHLTLNQHKMATRP